MLYALSFSSKYEDKNTKPNSLELQIHVYLPKKKASFICHVNKGDITSIKPFFFLFFFIFHT